MGRVLLLPNDRPDHRGVTGRRQGALSLRSNPKVPTEATERTGTHVVRFLEPATIDAYMDQREAEG